MPPLYWMITNRERKEKKLGSDRGELSYWESSSDAIEELKAWTPVSFDRFKRDLTRVASGFPVVPDEDNEMQKHVTLFIHGYNTDWRDAIRTYKKVHSNLFGESKRLGLCVLFSWPSDGMKLGYYPDRNDARATAPDLSFVFNELFDYMMQKQAECVEDAAKACRAKVSVIAHSMGNYVLQKAMQYTWTRKNQPLLVSLVNQLLMVAADVDNDLFKGGESSDKSDGDAIANLCYRIAALYSRKDSVLGLSAGFKHFGKRRLGRSGLDPKYAVPDNVCDVDCTDLIGDGNGNVHSAYFSNPQTIKLMEEILRGKDRKLLTVPASAPLVPELAPA